MGNRGNILIIIAARAGSKGLKNKNIRKLIDRPLIAYTIQQAVKWGKASNIVCSTDSRRIAQVARKYGADVPFIRPKHLAGDKVAKTKVLKHALINCEKIYRKFYDIVIDLDATAPLRIISDLDKCLSIFKRQRPKTLFSVVKSHRNPYFNMVEKKNGKVDLCKAAKKHIFARQDAPGVFDMNASIYFYRRDFLLSLKNSTAISDDSRIYIMDDISRDIDNEIDFKFIEFLMKEGLWKSEV